MRSDGGGATLAAAQAHGDWLQSLDASLGAGDAHGGTIVPTGAEAAPSQAHALTTFPRKAGPLGPRVRYASC